MSLPKLFFLLAGVLLAGCAQRSAQTILAELKARDALFDNAQLDYAQSGTISLYWDWQDPNLHANIEKFGNSETQDYTWHLQRIVRGSAYTQIGMMDKNMKLPPSQRGYAPGGTSFASNTRGVVRDISSAGTPGHRGSYVATIEATHISRLPGEQSAKAEYGLGFGFGKRILAIDSVETVGELTRIKGTMRMWTSDKSPFEIDLDKDLVVRRAKIVQSPERSYEIQTSGLVVDGDFKIAKEGSFTTIGPKVAYKLNDDDYKFSVTALRMHLPDDYYHAITTYTLQPGTQINDWPDNWCNFVTADGDLEKGYSLFAGAAKPPAGWSGPSNEKLKRSLGGWGMVIFKP